MLDGKTVSAIDSRIGYGISGNQAGISVDFTDGSDAIFVYTVPEATSLALLGLGGMALIGARRRGPSKLSHV